MFQSLRNYNFRLFWSAQCISLPGSWMQTIGLSWEVLKLSNRADVLGLVTMLQFLPILLFALVGGVVADRVQKRKFLILTQSISTLQALALGLLVYLNVIRLWEIYVLAAIGGLTAAFDNPTRQAFVVEMVGREDVANAVALNSGLFNAARIVGPAIGGWIIAVVGMSATFFFNAVSFIPALIALSIMDPNRFHATGHPPRGKMLPQVLEAWRYCFSLPGTTLIVVLMAAIGTFGFNFTVSLPLIARFAFHQGAQALGYLTASMGFGSVIGAIFLARSSSPSYRLFLVGGCAFSVFLACVWLSGNFYLTLGFLICTGFASLLGNATANTLLQINTPDELRGRVMSIYFLLLAGSTPIGGYFTGLLSQHIQIRPTIGIEAAICGVSVLWGIYYYVVKRLYRSDVHSRVTVRRAARAAQAALEDPADQGDAGRED